MMKGKTVTWNDIASRIYRPLHEIEKEQNGEKCIVEEPFGFDILPTMIAMQIVELFEKDEDDISARKGIQKECVLRDIVNIIKSKNYYDYILIDCPPNMGTFVFNALMASDYLLIPTSIGPFCTKGIEYTLSIANILEKKRNHKLKNLGILSSIYKKGQAANVSDEDILMNFPITEKILTNINYTIKAENNLIEGKLLSEANSDIRDLYINVAKEIVWKIDNYDKILKERKQRAEIVESLWDNDDIMMELEEELEEIQNLLSEQNIEAEQRKEFNAKRREVRAKIKECKETKKSLIQKIKDIENKRMEEIIYGS